MLEELGCRLALDDRVAPLVEPDGLGKELATKPVSHALDWVDAESDGQPRSLVRMGAGSTGGPAHRSHGPRRA